MKSMNPNRRFNSIARRIQRSWQWKKLGQIILLNLLALLAALAAYLQGVRNPLLQENKYQGERP